MKKARAPCGGSAPRPFDPLRSQGPIPQNLVCSWKVALSFCTSPV